MTREICCTSCSECVLTVDAYLSAEQLEGARGRCDLCGPGAVEIVDDGMAYGARFRPDHEVCDDNCGECAECVAAEQHHRIAALCVPRDPEEECDTWPCPPPWA